MKEDDMYVIKRDGTAQLVSFDKILNRVKKLGVEFNLKVPYTQLVMKVIDQLYNNIETTKIDELTAEQCASMSSSNLDYSRLASAIVISNLQKNTSNDIFETANQLYEFTDINNIKHNLIAHDVMQIIADNKEYLNSIIDYTRDYEIDYFGFKTLERAYLFKINNKVIERPQHMWMRVAIAIHKNNLDLVKETYDMMSQKYFTHATPTLFNAGTPRPQMSSCFLLSMEDDSIDGIFNTLKECAQISKWSGGIGLHIHNIRSTGSHIRGTNGTSNGLIPMLGVFNKTARYVDQGGKRNGSFAIYLEPHHPDIEEFLDLKKNHGDEESRARDLFYGLWISDLFMERVKNSEDWSLFCPDQCKGLSEVYGDEYKELYVKYENEGKAIKQMKARDLWIKILDSQMETGTPYLLYKDSCNKKSNQSNLGTIMSSNLCVAPETYILTDKGNLRIEHMQDKKVKVWNGYHFSEVLVKKTNDAAELITVKFNDGTHLECTKYHKFIIDSGLKKIHKVEAQDLKAGMKLIKCNYPNIDGNEYVLGAYDIGFRAYRENKDILFGDYSMSTKMEWLSGYMDGCDNILYNSLKGSITLPISNSTKCHHIKMMLQTCGINVSIIENAIHFKEDELRILFNNGLIISITIKNKEFLNVFFSSDEYSTTESDYESNVNDENYNGADLLNTSYERKKTDYSMHYVVVTEIEESGRIDRTYCFTEEQNNTAIFNGVITSQCTEIIEYSNKDETAVCNLASISLPKFVKDKKFDYEKLAEVVGVVVRNLNNIIDTNFYPNIKTRRSNLLHRPIGIGVQGLADAFILMDLPFVCDESKKANKYIFETIYYAAVDMSCKLACEREKDMMQIINEKNNWYINDDFDGLYHKYGVYNIDRATNSDLNEIDESLLQLLNTVKPLKSEISRDSHYGSYSSFIGSPMSDGKFQFDLWNKEPTDRYDWDELRGRVKKYGLRNSLLCAPMPTASTSQILGNNECFEPLTSNIYTRRTLAGEFVIVNKHLVQDLKALNLWSEEIKNNIIANRGSVQYIDGLSQHLKDKYKIVWEMSMRDIIDMSVDRGAYICQSQSLNLWMEDPEPKKLTTMHFYSWSQGLKTGIYYLRRKPKHQPQQFTIEPDKKNVVQEDEECLMCGS